MSLRVDGVLKTRRTVHELQTFIDMLGFKQESKEDSITLLADHFTLQLQQQISDIKISGTCAIEHTSLLRAFILALSADGIRYSIETFNQENHLVQSYQPD